MQSKIHYLAIVSAFFLTNLAASDAIHVAAEGDWVEFFSEKTIETGKFSLTISAPDGRVWHETWSGEEIPKVNLSAIFDGQVPDGQYNYEILPHLDRPQIEVAHQFRGLEPVGVVSPSAHIGTFTVISGHVLDPNFTESPTVQPKSSTLAGAATPSSVNDDESPDDQVINDDLIVTGSVCVGFDCVNGETFSFDTLRLKENNTRLTFIDTSSTSGFPSGDWQLRANDSNSGGGNFLSIDWLGTSASHGNAPVTTPFRVDGTAPTNAIRVASTGRIGFRTSNPVLDLHVATGNTPGLRLEQNNSSGFTAQTWDIAGNEANFFIRDVTGGSRLPFRIRPGAPTSSIDIAASGNVGIGTTSPSAALSVERSDGTAKLVVRETSGTSAIREMLVLENHGRPRFVFENTDASSSGPHKWTMDVLNNGRFRWTKGSSGSIEMELLPGGDLVIAGTLTQSSDRNKKDNFQQVNPQEVLERVMGLPITRWTFNHDASGAFHMGPMAQDFHAAFGLGKDETKIAPLDTSGVTLAAIQGLKMELDNRDQRIAELEQQVNELKAGVARVAEVEARLQELDQRIADAILVKREDVAGTPEVVLSRE